MSKLTEKMRRGAAEDPAGPGVVGRPEVFEREVPSVDDGSDGSTAHVVATTTRRNVITHDPRPIKDMTPASEPPSDVDLTVSESGEHPTYERKRPITWVIVAFIALSFVAAGIGVVLLTLWLLLAGLAAAAVGVGAGWAFRIMDPVEQKD